MKTFLVYSFILLSTTGALAMDENCDGMFTNFEDGLLEWQLHQNRKKILENTENFKKEFLACSTEKKKFTILGAYISKHYDVVNITLSWLDAQNDKAIAHKILEFAISERSGHKDGPKFINLLVDNGFNINDLSQEGIQALLLACPKAEETGKTNVLQTMLNRGADPRALNTFEHTGIISTFDFMRERYSAGTCYPYTKDVLILLSKAIDNKS